MMTYQNVAELSGVASVLVAGASLLCVVAVLRAAHVEAGAAIAIVRYTAYMLVAIGLLGASFLSAGELGFLLWLVAMGIWIRAAMHYRAVQRRNLFSALALAVERQMPLAPMALAVAAEQEGGFSERVRMLATRLEHGTPLPQALRQSRGIFPPEAILAASVGFETGDLRGALQATTYATEFDRSTLQPIMARVSYMMVIIVSLIGILTFLEIKVAPSYVKIFDDFGSPLPASFGFLIHAANILAPLSFLVPLALVILGILVWLQWRGTIYPILPGLRRIVNWVDMAPVLRVLALAARRNRPLVGVLRATTQHYPKWSVRSRMWHVLGDLDNGLSWQDSLRSRGLMRRQDAAILSAAERSGNLSWALTEMAEGFERKAALRLRGLAQVVLPLVMLPIGVLVALVAVAHFTPIVKLITDMS